MSNSTNRIIAERIDNEDGKGVFFKCPLCSYLTSFEYTISRHITAVHQGLKPYSCSYCQYQSSYKQHLRLHCQRVHKIQLKPSDIPSCEGDIKCEIDNNVKQERFETKRRKKPNSSNRKDHQCPDCVYATSRKESLQRHIKAIHQKIRPFSCSYCTYETPYNYHLKTHNERHHPWLAEQSTVCESNIWVGHPEENSD